MATQFDDECVIEVPIRFPLVEIERLTRIAERARRAASVAPVSVTPEVNPGKLADVARFVLAMRRSREIALPLIEFGEPAWDMLLDLYIKHVEGKKVSVSSLCTASAVPATTALRWIDALVCRGHFVRSHDPSDGRRVHVDLSPALVGAIEAFLADTRRRAMAALR